MCCITCCSQRIPQIDLANISLLCQGLCSAGAIDTVATTGKFEIRPNTVNSVPREAKLEIDIRDIDKDRRDRVVSEVLAKVKKIASARGVDSTADIINQDPPTHCDEQVCCNSTFVCAQPLIAYLCLQPFSVGTAVDKGVSSLRQLGSLPILDLQHISQSMMQLMRHGTEPVVRGLCGGSWAYSCRLHSPLLQISCLAIMIDRLWRQLWVQHKGWGLATAA